MHRYLLSVCLAACAAAYDPYYYTYPVDYAYTYTYDDYYWYSGVYGYYPTYVVRDDAEAAANAAAHAPQFFTPEGCATATSSGNVMTVTFANCDGPGNLTGV